jgi:hypothetical protein
MFLHAQSIEVTFVVDGEKHVFACSTFHHDNHKEPSMSAYRQGWDVAVGNVLGLD